MLFKTSNGTTEQDNPIPEAEILSETVLNSNLPLTAITGFKLSPPAKLVVEIFPLAEMMLFRIEKGPLIETPPAIPSFAAMVDDSIVTMAAPVENTPAVPSFL